jgi:hypothetical protein
MRNHVRQSRSERSHPAFEEGRERDLHLAAPLPDDVEDAEPAEDADDADDEFGDVVRLTCPDCGRPISVLADEESLPEHALCATPWNPFGLTVCGGSGRAVAEARPLDGIEAVGAGGEVRVQELVVLLTLPAGLDWRTQPFSHVGGPGSRPMRVAEQPLAA